MQNCKKKKVLHNACFFQNFESFTKEELVIEKLETSDLRYLINYQITVKNYSLSQVKNGLKKNHELSLLIESEFNK